MNALAGKRILVVEDDPILSLTLEDMIVDFGGHVLGPFAWLEEAVAAADSERIDAAVLDVNVNGGHSFPAAERLLARGIPFVFATGYAREGLDTAIVAPILHKPYQQQQLAAALAELLGGSASP
jgi:CheY-like chemotaxis protein